jgi:hypothetical protein
VRPAPIASRIPISKCPRELEVQDVGTGDREHQGRHPLENPCELAHSGHSPKARIGFPVRREVQFARIPGLGGFDLARNDLDFCLQLGLRGVRLEAADHP